MKLTRLRRLLLVFLAGMVMITSGALIRLDGGYGPLRIAQNPEPALAANLMDFQNQIGESEVTFWVVRAYFDDPAMVNELAQWLEPWEVRRDLGYLVVGVDQVQLEMLEQAGFRLVVDEKLTAKYNQPRLSLPDQATGIPGYPCYRTVEETYQAAQDIVTNYPQLATWSDIGDSWEKYSASLSSGYDLMVLRLTNLSIPGPKPVLFITASMHAREYTPAELATRFAEYLVENYGKNPDLSWILDTREIHMLLQANPDGRKQAETGLTWRKNTNQNYCSPTSIYRGADLNRNFAFKWGCCDGSSSNPCSILYRGPEPASEPETLAIQDYLRLVFEDQRGPLPTDPAPLATQGLVLDLHSYSRLVLWPWGYTTTPAPNDVQMQTLGRKIAYFNKYTPTQSVDLYITDGDSIDFAYGELGIPAYTIELGNDFFETCDVFENDILPDNLPALVYAAKIADLPYLTPSGPDVVNLTAAKPGLRSGEPVLFSATIDDSRYNSSLEPTHKISEAEYYLDTPPTGTASLATAHKINAADGTFDQKIERIEVAIPTIGLTPGRHTLYVRAKDISGVWGPLSSLYFYLVDPNSAASLKGFVRSAGSDRPLSATIQSGPFSTTSQPDTGAYTLPLLPGTYDIQVSAPGFSLQTVTGLTLSPTQVLEQDFSLLPLCILNTDDVETGAPGWTAEPTWTVSSESYHSPTHAWNDSPGTTYTNYKNSSLISPVMNLSGLTDPTVKFWQQYDVEDGYDYARVEISLDGGTTWSLVKAFTGRKYYWNEVQLPLAQLANQSQVRLRFRLTSDVDITRDGWYIDDIEISASAESCQENLAPISEFSVNSPILVGQPAVFTNLSQAYPSAAYTWDFGDGSPASTEREPLHVYQNPGEYLVQLTAANTFGVDSASRTLLVTRFAFSLQPGQVYQLGQPGELVTYTIEIHNTGLEPDTYQLNIDSVWETQVYTAQGDLLPGNQVSLDPGGVQALLLAVRIPITAVAAQDIPSELIVTSSGLPGYTQVVSVTSQADWHLTRLPLAIK